MLCSIFLYLDIIQGKSYVGATLTDIQHKQCSFTFSKTRKLLKRQRIVKNCKYTVFRRKNFYPAMLQPVSGIRKYIRRFKLIYIVMIFRYLWYWDNTRKNMVSGLIERCIFVISGGQRFLVKNLFSNPQILI